MLNVVLRMHICAGSSDTLSHVISTKITCNDVCPHFVAERFISILNEISSRFIHGLHEC